LSKLRSRARARGWHSIRRRSFPPWREIETFGHARLPSPAEDIPRQFKYRVAFVVDQVCVVRFDNDTGNCGTSISGR
jgi:hypothetical protein